MHRVFPGSISLTLASLIPDRDKIVFARRGLMAYNIRIFPNGNNQWRDLLEPLFPIGNETTMTDIIKESPQAIGEFVRARRQASSLTQQELGELAGVGTRFISELERGKTTLRMDAVNRVLRVFGKMLSHIEAPRNEGG